MKIGFFPITKSDLAEILTKWKVFKYQLEAIKEPFSENITRKVQNETHKIFEKSTSLPKNGQKQKIYLSLHSSDSDKSLWRKNPQKIHPLVPKPTSRTDYIFEKDFLKEEPTPNSFLMYYVQQFQKIQVRVSPISQNHPSKSPLLRKNNSTPMKIHPSNHEPYLPTKVNFNRAIRK